MLSSSIAVILAVLPLNDPVSYRLEVVDSGAKKGVRVEIRLPAVAAPSTLIVPRAIPMGYGIAPYDRFYQDVRAFDASGAPIDVERSRFGPRFALGSSSRVPAVVRYSVDIGAMEDCILSASDSSKARDGYVGLLGYSVFAFVEGLDDRPVRLTIEAPPDWPVFTTLAPRAPPDQGTVEVGAASFYALADSQLLLGPRVTVLRAAAGDRQGPLPDAPEVRPRYDARLPALFVAGYAECDVDWTRIGDLGQIALERLVDWFGSAPFPYYTMVVEFVKPRSPDHEYGFSMEHLDSGTFFFETDQAITASIDGPGAARALYNYAHHIAHSWLPKRCAMAGYYPFPWEYAPSLDSIWFSEGFGQYAAADALEPVRPGIREKTVRERFESQLAETPLSLRRLPLAEVSRLASTQYSDPFATGVNVFARGGLMAAEIDAEVRRRTSGAKSLRDGIRVLVARCGASGRPCDVADLVACVKEATGVDARAIVDRFLQPMAEGR